MRFGSFFDPKLSFNYHANQTVNSTYRTLGFVIRSGREFSDLFTLKFLFNTYVKSKLEYAFLVWSPVYNINIIAFETIQRRFLKSLIYTIDGSYPLRGFPQELVLQKANMSSLQIRRTQHSVIFLYKLLCSLYG